MSSSRGYSYHRYYYAKAGFSRYRDCEDDDEVTTKNASMYRIERWKAALVINASQWFQYNLDLKKQEDKEAMIVFRMAGERKNAINDYRQSLQFQNLNVKQNILSEVIKGGKKVEVPVFDIVVGDVIPVKIGDQVPADGILVLDHSLALDESIMTGEPKIHKMVNTFPRVQIDELEFNYEKLQDNNSYWAKVPADGIFYLCHSLELDESSMTGEPMIHKPVTAFPEVQIDKVQFNYEKLQDNSYWVKVPADGILVLGHSIALDKSSTAGEPKIHKTVNAFPRVQIDEVKFNYKKLQDNSYWVKDGVDGCYVTKEHSKQWIFSMIKVRSMGVKHVTRTFWGVGYLFKVKYRRPRSSMGVIKLAMHIFWRALSHPRLITEYEEAWGS